ncbi:MAG: hypothetical protein HRT67_12105 [Flavobacteriaceae bacterium]|nr:hypothetical protein [Flavobacteriaceae bacterium]
MKTITNIIQYTFLCSIVLLSLGSCSEENELIGDPFVVAFNQSDLNTANMAAQEEIMLDYSRVASQSGTFEITIDTQNTLEYGVDYVTVPEAVDNVIYGVITTGTDTNSIVFETLSSNFDDTTVIKLTVANIDYQGANIQGNSQLVISSEISSSGSVEPNLGGANEGNQVYVDLSSRNTTEVQRDSWDLGFYSGDAFRVTINGSIYMATKALSETNIDAISASDVASLQSQVAVGTFNADNSDYVDAPNGSILETAIDEISSNAIENPVYLVNLGYEVGTDEANVGSVAIVGEHRGWKKIRILRSGEDYVLQYADLDDTTHQEITISKNQTHNFSHFSFNTNTIVDVEPQREKWDLCFTVFTNVIPDNGSYGFSDFVYHNRKGGALAYQVNTSEYAYDDFSIANVNEASFSENQATIGSNWRSVFNGVFQDRFFILKDTNGNIYKIKFLALTNENGERGYPKFQYDLLIEQ